MSKNVTIDNVSIGEDHQVYFIGEIGINHNGDIELAKKLVTIATGAGCNAVKFQKRTPELCVPEKQRNIMRETPWGLISYLDYRKRIELGENEYNEINRFCKEMKITWFASPWDEESVDFLDKYDTPCYKIPSAKLTDDKLLRYIKSKSKPVILSSGLSELKQLDHAIDILGKKNLIVLHCCGAYPADYKDLNLKLIPYYKDRYNVPVGYSGHETGLPASIAAVALGACIIERHITLDRAMWGSDHAASLEPTGLTKLIRDVRLVEKSMGNTNKRILSCEESIIHRLRNV